MSFVSSVILIDAPASALNNAGSVEGARTDNTIAVKRIQSAYGSFPYVSAQAFRYWLRTTLEHTDSNWKAAPVHREGKIAYTDANPIQFWDDDLFGYMRAPSKKTDAKKAEGASPLEKDRDITRVAPFRVSTFVSVSPVAVTSDFGTMTRQEGDPVPYEHEFYKAHLVGSLSLDLSASGTFFDGERVGFRNLDSFRRDEAKKFELEETKSRKQKVFRLPLMQRQTRVHSLFSGIARIMGGAKQSLHYTDLTPAFISLTVTKFGNNPFQRFFTDRQRRTAFHREAFLESWAVYQDQLQSKLYVGWAQGFLDDERRAFEEAIESLPNKDRIEIVHPVTAIHNFLAELNDGINAQWYD